MWVKFVSVHWHRFNRQMKRRYMPGEVRNVPANVGKLAIEAGAAIKMKKPSRTAPVEVDNGEET